jgi:hypothetical protein
MATYTAATFIPQLQPYQPDLNLYANLIQNSQTQYDSNWKSLNKIYGQYFYADLTREDNAKKKDYLLNQINFNVGRLAGLDLSLQQNVAQATQVFKPFYEDKALMKDMAWTKNYNSQVGRAQALQGSADEKRRAEFWDTGLKELQYKREEFKEATADKAMGMGNVLYTPYVNVQDKALELAKEYGDIQTVTRSEDGRWLIKKTNGEALEEPLSKLFEANMGSDPQIQAIYQTQSYVNRKDYAQSNAAQFNGDKNAAEMKYLENNFTILKDQSKKRYESLQKNSTVYDSKIKDLQAQIKNGTASPDAQNLLDNYMEGKQINDSVLERAKKDYDTMSSGESNTATTSTGFKNPYGDIESLRFKVDNGVASSLMQKDLDEAAHVFAYRHYKEDPEADPYAILAEKHQNTMAEISARTQGQMQVAEYKAKLKDKQDSDQSKVDAGTHYKDKDGNLVEFEDQNFVTTVPNDKGNTTDRINLKSKSREISNMTKQEYVDPFFHSTFKVIDKAINDNKMSAKTAAYILGYSKDKKVSAKEFIDKYQKYGDSWLRKYVGQDGMNSIKNRMNTWVGKNRQLSIFTENGQRTQLYKDYQNGNAKMDDYMLYLKSDQKWRKDSAKSVEKTMMKEGYNSAYLLYDNNGNLRTEREFYKELAKVNPEIKKLMGTMGTQGYSGFGLKDKNQTRGSMADREGGGGYTGEGSIYDIINYKELVDKAGQLYSNSKVVKGKPARLGSGPIDPGTGLSTIGSSSIVVNPKGMSAGKAHFGEIAQALNGFDWGGNTDRFTLGGLSKSAYDNSPKARRDAQGQALAKAIMMDFNKAQMKGSKSKLSQFELRVSPIAAGNSKLAAVTIIPNKEWLAEYKSTNDKTPNNLLTSEEYTKALTHGLTFVMDNSKLNNVTMYKQSYSSPIASYVESFKKYELKNIGGDSNKSYTIEKNELGTGDYITTVTFPEFDPVKGTIVKKTYRSNDVMQGGYLETNRDQILNWFNEVDDNNNYLFNNYTRVE